jgi:hypothetical protein
MKYSYWILCRQTKRYTIALLNNLLCNNFLNSDICFNTHNYTIVRTLLNLHVSRSEYIDLCTMNPIYVYIKLKLSTVILLKTTGWPTQCLSPGRGKICLFSTSSRKVLGPTQPPIQCIPAALYPVVRRPGVKLIT